jgi:photosystem II Psb27 protein
VAVFAALRGFGQQLVRAGLQLLLLVALAFGLSACGGTPSGLSGSYVDDTVSVATSLLNTIAPEDGKASSEQQQQARELINDYIALYRPNGRVNGLASFTTMQTALNSLAGHYANYNNRPLPDDLRARLEKELHKAELSVVRGS